MRSHGPGLRRTRKPAEPNNGCRDHARAGGRRGVLPPGRAATAAGRPRRRGVGLSRGIQVGPTAESDSDASACPGPRARRFHDAQAGAFDESRGWACPRAAPCGTSRDRDFHRAMSGWRARPPTSSLRSWGTLGRRSSTPSRRVPRPRSDSRRVMPARPSPRCGPDFWQPLDSPYESARVRGRIGAGLPAARGRRHGDGSTWPCRARSSSGLGPHSVRRADEIVGTQPLTPGGALAPARGRSCARLPAARTARSRRRSGSASERSTATSAISTRSSTSVPAAATASRRAHPARHRVRRHPRYQREINR